MTNKKREAKKTEAWSLDEFLADYRPLQRVVPITTRGDLIGQLEQLEDELEAAQEAEGDGGLGEPADVLTIARKIASVREQVRATERDFIVVSMGDRAWSDLIAKHPPDKDDPETRMFPWNPETFYAEAMALSIEQPSMTVDQVEKLLERLAPGQTKRLVNAVLAVNGGGGDLPKSEASSVLRQASKRKSGTARRGEFPDHDSLGE